MKKLISLTVVTLLFIMSSMMNFLHGQIYHKLIRTNTYWDVYQTIPPEMCYSYANRIYFSNDDTIIDGHTYKKSFQYSFQQVNPGPFCPPFVVLNTSSGTSFYLREDTVERKVFIYCDACSPPSDDLFYDFNLTTGDTLKSLWASFNWPSTHPIVCSSVDSIQLFTGEYRKRINVSSDNSPAYYLESIGGCNGLFQPLYAVPAWGGYFCQSQDNVNLFGFDCDNFFVGIDQDNAKCKEIRWKKSANILSFSGLTCFIGGELQVVDIMGRVFINKKVLLPEARIDVTFLSKGVYLVIVRNDRQKESIKITID